MPGKLIGVNRGVIAFGFPVDQTFLKERFASNTAAESTVALGVDCSGDLDFSSVSGLANVSLGAVTYGGTLTPARGVYRLGGGGGTLTLRRPLRTEGALFIGPGEVRLAAGSSFGTVVITRATLRVGGLPVPATPTSLRAEAMAGNRVKLTWLDGAVDETAYIVSASVNSGEWRDVKTLPRDTVEAVLAFRPGRALAYRVAATCPGGRSAPSNVVEVDTRPIALRAPALVDVTGGYKWLDLKWKDTNAGEVGHVVEHSTDGVTFAEAERVYGRDRIRAHLYMPRTQTNHVRVAAFGFDGRPGPWSDTLTAKTDADADVQRDLLERFDLLSPDRRFDPSAPASLPSYTDAEKEAQRAAGKDLVADITANVKSFETYTIPAGVYRIPELVTISEKECFRINAAGVRIFYEGAKSGPVFRFRRCAEGTLAGPLIIQQEVPHWSVGRILKVDRKAHTTEAEILPGYTPDFAESKRRRWFPVTPEGYQVTRASYSKVENLGGRRIRLHFKSRGGDALRVGGYLTLTSSVPEIHPVYGDRLSGVSRNMTYRDITGYGPMTEHYHEHEDGTVRFINYRILPQPGTSQLACGQPGQYFMGRSATLVMDGCEFQTAWDDGINLSTLSGMVSAQDAPVVVYLVRLTTDIRAGDMLRFYDYVKLTFLGEGRIREMEMVEDPRVVNGGNFWFKTHRCCRNDRTKAMKVTLDRGVGNVVFAQALNADLGAADVVVRNTYWRDMQPDAVMLQSATSGLIANNLFFRNGGPAVHAQMNQYWQEGKWPDNLIIVNNVMWDNPPVTNPGKGTYASIRAHAGENLNYVFGDRSEAPLLANFIIDGNRIHDPAWSGIRLANMKDALIIRNLIVHPGRVGNPEPDTADITLLGGTGITVKDNTVILNGSPVEEAIHVGPGVDRKTLTLEGNRVIDRQEVEPRPRFGK